MAEESALLRRIELFLNEQQADLTVFRVILQTFFSRVISTQPDRAEQALVELKSSALGALSRLQIDPPGQGAERKKQLTLMRAEAFFQELEEALKEARKMEVTKGSA